ncbi:MAG: M1 family metallopeptidase [Proteobacteria bacterium]|nr:M1 family metallopeptidase [Pseudomonadota bacterium]
MAVKKRPRKKKAARAKKSAPERVRAFRLSPHVRPRDVDVAVELDPSRSTAFKGTVAFDLELDRRKSAIELHAADLRVGRARVWVDGAMRRGQVVPHPERQTVEIRFDAAVPAGSARLELAFSGRLRADLCGLYQAKVGEQRYAFTQLEAADARKFFPCFDEPAMKARFQLSVTTGAGNAVISNSPAERVERHGDGTQTVQFARTPLLSSYLVALAVGELDCSEAAFAGSTEIRVWHVPGKGGLVAFALEAARETLLRLEAYFDLPYPYAKLDLVAVPDFEFGAMENAGAVFFRETLLLMDPATVTLMEKKRAAEVICHELAHMWYGDLVTMAWWDDLWLNEAFATWMAFHVVDQWKPEWKMWQDFLLHRAAALDLDALRNTHPIYTTVRTPDDANANFDVITYEKGASVVRMIERYLGADVFRDGVRRYIRRHRESNTVAADLWNALSEVSGEKVDRVVRAWIEQEGYPAVTVRRVEVDGTAYIELRQDRFYERPPRTAPSPAPRWPVPWVGRIGDGFLGNSHSVRHLLTKRRDRIPADGADLSFVYGNADEGGFFRPQHDEDVVKDLIENLNALSPLERMGFVDHQWALLRAGRSSVASLLDLIAALGVERDADVLCALRRPLATMTRRLAPDTGPDIEARLRAWIEVYYGAQVDELGWAPAANEDAETSLRRAEILSIVGGIGRATAVLEEAQRQCAGYLADRRALDPNLADPVVAMAAADGDKALYDSFLSAMRGASTPQEHRRFLLALGDFEDPALVDRTLALSLTDDVATQDVVFVLVRLLANREARERTWEFIKRRWPRLRPRLAPLLATRLIDATPGLGTRAHRQDVARFFRENPIPSGSRALRQALERFDWYAEYRRRAGPELAAYLSGLTE